MNHGYSLKALAHRARHAEYLRNAEYLLMMEQFSPEQLVNVDETCVKPACPPAR